MARDKDQDESIRHNPFSTLKGFAVSGEKPVKAEKRKTETKPVVPPAQKPAGDETDLFAAEMAMLGVRPAGRKAEAAVDSGGKRRSETEEAEIFRSAIDELDEVPVRSEPTARHGAAPRRVKRLQRGELTPQAELDLHGLHRDQALQKVRYFLENAAFHGLQTVLLVTGRGNRSEEGPVLRAAVEDYLARGGRAWALEWTRAPRHLGGEGALVVFLRQGEE